MPPEPRRARSWYPAISTGSSAASGSTASHYRPTQRILHNIRISQSQAVIRTLQRPPAMTQRSRLYLTDGSVSDYDVPIRYTDFGGHKIGHAGRDRARNAVYLAPAAAEIDLSAVRSGGLARYHHGPATDAAGPQRV